MLACADCDAVHDVDLAPDTGACVVCGGPLIQDEVERDEVGGNAYRSGLRETADLVNERLAKAGIQARLSVAPLKPAGED